MENRVDEFIENPKRALFVLAAPIAIAMFVQAMYNIVDTAWVGRLGAESIAALTFAFPIFFILIGLNSGIGVGINSIISRRPLHPQASVFFVRSHTGGSQAFPRLYVNHHVGHLLHVSCLRHEQHFFRPGGDTKTPMKIQVSALIFNAVLDPIFIYPLGLGVAGAALATVCTFAFSLLLYVYYVQKKSASPQM